MKILFLSQIVPYPPKGGVLQRSYHILKEIAKGNEVHLLAFNHPDILDSQAKRDEAKEHLLSFCNTVDFVNFEIKVDRMLFLRTVLQSFFSTLPFSVLAHRSSEFQQAFNRLCTEHRFDILHYDTIALAQYPFPANTGVTSLAHHNIESDLMLKRAKTENNVFSRLFLFLNGKKIRSVEKRFCPTFTCNTTCSEVDKKSLLSLCPDIDIRVVPNGVDTEYFKPQPGLEQRNQLVHIGALQSANLDGIEHFLKNIWPLILKRKEQVTLKLVGANAPPFLQKLARQRDNITLTDYVEDVRPHAHRASLLIVPLRFGGGTKLKILDGLALGKTIVSTSIGTEGINVTPGYNIIVADTPQEFARQVSELLENPQKCKEIGERGRKLVEEQYDWNSIGELQRKIFTDILAKTR